MKLTRSFVLKALRLITLLAAGTALTSHADDYADISQLLRINKFPEALTKVDSQLVSKPTDPQLRFFKGVIQRHLGKPTEAVATFTKLTEDYPELPEPYNNLAVLYANQGQYDKARAALEMAIRTNPSYATAHENMGDVYARLASQAYNKALQLDGGNNAVPPKLALIRELFKPNLANPKPVAGNSAVIAAATPAPAPALPKAKPASALVPAANVPTAASSAAPTKSATAVATPPAPAVKPTSTAVDADASKAVEAAVMAWAQAWSNKDMSAYLAAYSLDFETPGKQPRSVWEQDRTARITGKSHINVKLSELSIKVTGDEALARFRQTYKADRLSVSSRKTLQLRNHVKNWLIIRESTGN
ncbi:MAG: tetratricopeptide repeat protein [Rhodoferax sp.]|nr:tetratricopeptide repeat protein [Rhodoferax sp.]